LPVVALHRNSWLGVFEETGNKITQNNLPGSCMPDEAGIMLQYALHHRKISKERKPQKWNNTEYIRAITAVNALKNSKLLTAITNLHEIWLSLKKFH
jgi:hypothetical protein